MKGIPRAKTSLPHRVKTRENIEFGIERADTTISHIPIICERSGVHISLSPILRAANPIPIFSISPAPKTARQIREHGKQHGTSHQPLMIQVKKPPLFAIHFPFHAIATVLSARTHRPLVSSQTTAIPSAKVSPLR